MKNISHIKLWQERQPLTSNGIKEDEVYSYQGGLTEVANVTNTELIIYSPDDKDNRGIAVIICPGGGYTKLPITLQGYDFAEWLTSIGITGIVLKYRTPNGHKKVPIEDVKEAMQYVRNHAGQLTIDPARIGVAGFSVGGHLAAIASNTLLPDNWHPAFTLLFYPVITMGEHTHQSSRKNLLGESFTEKDIQKYSCENLVTSNSPTALIFANDDDSVVSPINSTIYYDVLKKYNIPASLHIFPQGGHAWGIKGKNASGGEFKDIDIVRGILKKWLLTN